MRELAAAFEHQFKSLDERLAGDIEEGGKLYELASTAPFDKAAPFKDLGIRRVNGNAYGNDLQIEEVALATAEFSGTVGMDQMLKHGNNDAKDE